MIIADTVKGKGVSCLENVPLMHGAAPKGELAEKAVIELNNSDGGNRKYILCEQMDYTEGITVERVRRVIKEKKTGSFKTPPLGELNILPPSIKNLRLDKNRKFRDPPYIFSVSKKKCP